MSASPSAERGNEPSAEAKRLIDNARNAMFACGEHQDDDKKTHGENRDDYERLFVASQAAKAALETFVARLESAASPPPEKWSSDADPQCARCGHLIREHPVTLNHPSLGPLTCERSESLVAFAKRHAERMLEEADVMRMSPSPGDQEVIVFLERAAASPPPAPAGFTEQDVRDVRMSADTYERRATEAGAGPVGIAHAERSNRLHALANRLEAAGSAPPSGAGVSEENRAERFLREIMWLGHGCLGLYGDDGEMQCQCPRDWKREPTDMLIEWYKAKRMERAKQAIVGAARTAPAPREET